MSWRSWTAKSAWVKKVGIGAGWSVLKRVGRLFTYHLLMIVFPSIWHITIIFRTSTLHNQSELLSFDINRILQETKARLEKKRDRLSTIVESSSNTNFDPNVVGTVIEQCNYFRNAWRDRKKMCMSVVEILHDAQDGKGKIVDLMVILFLCLFLSNM